MPLPERLELERQVVAERPVQAQVRIRAGEGGDDLAQGREHRGPPAPLLLGEHAVGLRNDDVDAARDCCCLPRPPPPPPPRPPPAGPGGPPPPATPPAPPPSPGS